MTQLDLLNWRAPAVVIPFPAARQVGKIIHVAAKLRERRGQEKAFHAYWRACTDAMTRQMLRAQLSPKTIAQQLAAFEDAVQAEMHRQELIESYRRQP